MPEPRSANFCPKFTLLLARKLALGCLICAVPIFHFLCNSILSFDARCLRFFRAVRPGDWMKQAETRFCWLCRGIDWLVWRWVWGNRWECLVVCRLVWKWYPPTSANRYQRQNGPKCSFPAPSPTSSSSTRAPHAEKSPNFTALLQLWVLRGSWWRRVERWAWRRCIEIWAILCGRSWKAAIWVCPWGSLVGIAPLLRKPSRILLRWYVRLFRRGGAICWRGEPSRLPAFLSQQCSSRKFCNSPLSSPDLRTNCGSVPKTQPIVVSEGLPWQQRAAFGTWLVVRWGRIPIPKRCWRECLGAVEYLALLRPICGGRAGLSGTAVWRWIWRAGTCGIEKALPRRDWWLPRIASWSSAKTGPTPWLWPWVVDAPDAFRTRWPLFALCFRWGSRWPCVHRPARPAASKWPRCVSLYLRCGRAGRWSRWSATCAGRRTRRFARRCATGPPALFPALAPAGWNLPRDALGLPTRRCVQLCTGWVDMRRDRALRFRVARDSSIIITLAGKGKGENVEWGGFGKVLLLVADNSN